ncbi:MAG: hypothetical protein U0903_17640 [Planctomycetales bacterium]
MAGRPCRCKKCGHRFKIPQPGGQVPELVGAGAVQSPLKMAAPLRKPEAKAPPVKSLVSYRVLASIQSQIALAPVSSDRIRAMQAARHDADEFDVNDRDPYALAEPIPVPGKKKKKFRPGKAVKKTYSNELRKLQKWMRYLNERGLELTVPFFVLIPFGYILQNSWLAMLGLAGVVVLNLARLAVGLANILIIPFRKSPMEGVRFLCTFPFYIKNDWKQFSRPVGRVISPISFIVGVGLMYIFLPTWFGHKPPVKAGRDANGKAKDERSMYEKVKENVTDRVQQAKENASKDLTKGVKSGQELIKDNNLQEIGKKAVDEAGKIIDTAKDTVVDQAGKIQEQLNPSKDATPPPAAK